MLGAVAGDIIGSPFEWLNAEDGNFELCRTNNGFWHGRSVASHPRFTDDTVMTLSVARWMMNDPDHGKGTLVESMLEMAARYPRAGYTPRFMRWLQSEYHNPLVNYGNGAAMRVSPVGMMCDDLSDLMSLSALSAGVSHNHPDSIKGAQAVAQAVWMASRGRSKEDIIFAMTHDFGYEVGMDEESLKALLRGCTPEPVLVNGEDTGHVYYRETGKIDSSSNLSVTAALKAFNESDNFEEAVRGAIALGGDSNTIASICGAIAAPFYGGVPRDIDSLCGRFLDSGLRSVMESFEGCCTRVHLESASVELPKVKDTLSVIRMKGHDPVFVVEKDRKDIAMAIRRKFGEDVEIIEPKNLKIKLSSLCSEKGVGTFLAEAQPEVRSLRYEEGELKGPLTYRGPNAAPLSDRQAAYSTMRDILDYAMQVKSELQRRSGFLEEGDVRYEHAYYPVIWHNRVDIYQGPYLDGSVTFDEYGGKMHVALDGEMREGEYLDADWCRERVFDPNRAYLDAASVKEAIARFCLDDGVSVRDMERRSNIDTAADDLSRSKDPRINPDMGAEERKIHLPTPK